MTDELRKAIADYFDAGDFAEYIGVTTEDLINAFPEEVNECLEDILELMGLEPDNEDDYGEDRE